MKKNSRGQWELDVVALLNKLSVQGSLVERFEINRLISVYSEIEKQRESKRQNRIKVAAMRKISGTETIRVNKKNNERLKELLTEATKLIEE